MQLNKTNAILLATSILNTHTPDHIITTRSQSELVKNFSITHKQQTNKNDDTLNISKYKHIQAIHNTLSKLQSRDDIPFEIKYPENNRYSLPTKIDMLRDPKQNNKLTIQLNKRKYEIIPRVGEISDIEIKNGNIILNINLGLFQTQEIYDPPRMTKLLLQLREYKGEKYQDIPKTPGALVQEIHN